MPSIGGRLLDTPLSESAYIGAAVGAAACGMRPVAELMFIDFMGVCFDQIFNQAAKFKYMFGGKAETPVVIRAMVGAGFRAAAQHSQMLTPLFTHIPGLKVVCPSNAYDAKGLLIQSIRDNDPVIFCEHKNLYGVETDVPRGVLYDPVRRSERRARRQATCTIVTYGMMVHRAMDAADDLAKKGVECEVIDLRTLSPIDWDTVIESVENTGRLRLRRRGPSALLDRLRCLREGGAGSLQVAEGRHPDGDRAAHAGAVLARARGSLHPERGADRRSGPAHHGQVRPADDR